MSAWPCSENSDPCFGGGGAVGSGALTRRRIASDLPQGMDMIFLYRWPILNYWCETGEDLTHLVRHVLIHEIGHHFGLSDEDMERIEAEAAEG